MADGATIRVRLPDLLVHFVVVRVFSRDFSCLSLRSSLISRGTQDLAEYGSHSLPSLEDHTFWSSP